MGSDLSFWKTESPLCSFQTKDFVALMFSRDSLSRNAVLPRARKGKGAPFEPVPVGAHHAKVSCNVSCIYRDFH